MSVSEHDSGFDSLEDLEDFTEEGEPDDGKVVEEGRAVAILSYIPFGCFLTLVNLRHNPFAMKHAANGLVLTIIEILALLFLVPRVSEVFWIMIIILCVAFAVVGVIGVVQGRVIKLPIISDIARRLKLN